MNDMGHRKHPRVFAKKAAAGEDRVLTLSAAAAAGILGIVFIKGLFWGYMLKRHLDD